MVARVAMVTKFQSLSFSGYQSCKGCKSWRISDLIIFRISKLEGLQNIQISDFMFLWISKFRGFERLEDKRLYHSQDIKVARVA